MSPSLWGVATDGELVVDGDVAANVAVTVDIAVNVAVTVDVAVDE